VDVIRAAGLLLGTFLFCGIPFGYLIGRAGGVDVRREGSGNIGATNLLRTRGRVAGALTLVLDILKGAAPVVVARGWFPEVPFMPIGVAFVAVLGHCFSPYLAFRGGKGVATALGAFVVLLPPAAAGALVLFAGVVAATRLVALGSVVAALGFSPLAWLLGSPTIAAGSLPTAALIVLRHRENLRRIRAGTETRLGARRGGESR
jgi:glycerol-3-phosphate acyltransferase PlsY